MLLSTIKDDAELKVVDTLVNNTVGLVRLSVVLLDSVIELLLCTNIEIEALKVVDALVTVTVGLVRLSVAALDRAM